MLRHASFLDDNDNDNFRITASSLSYYLSLLVGPESIESVPSLI